MLNDSQTGWGFGILGLVRGIFEGGVGSLTILAFLTLGCASPTSAPEIAVETMSLQGLYPEALRVAQAWKGDAYLVDAQTTFWVGGSEGYRYANFSFRSPSTDVVGLFVGYDPETGLFEDEWLSIAKVDPQREPEIRDADWPIDSFQALEIVQAAGGAEFLSGRVDRDLYMYLRLKTRQEGEQAKVVWIAAYYDETASQSLIVVIDALTGNLVEMR
jgi:hypothetical protein